jgi:hypothetical protein
MRIRLLTTFGCSKTVFAPTYTNSKNKLSVNNGYKRLLSVRIFTANMQHTYNDVALCRLSHVSYIKALKKELHPIVKSTVHITQQESNN